MHLNMSFAGWYRELVEELSSLRNTHGFWHPTSRLQALLLCKTAASKSDTAQPQHDIAYPGIGNDADTADESKLDHRLNVTRPKICEDDVVWTTVLVLAFLSMHCAAEQQLWANMQSKAVLWLRGTSWGARGSVAGAVAAARKGLQLA